MASRHLPGIPLGVLPSRVLLQFCYGYSARVVYEARHLDLPQGIRAGQGIRS
jgi:hypothetical protein